MVLLEGQLYWRLYGMPKQRTYSSVATVSHNKWAFRYKAGTLVGGQISNRLYGRLIPGLADL